MRKKSSVTLNCRVPSPRDVFLANTHCCLIQLLGLQMNASLREYYPFSRLANLSDSRTEKIVDFVALGGKEGKCLTV